MLCVYYIYIYVHIVVFIFLGTVYIVHYSDNLCKEVGVLLSVSFINDDTQHILTVLFCWIGQLVFMMAPGLEEEFPGGCSARE